MVANFNNSRTAEMIQALATIPQDWALTPVNGNKRAYIDDWPKQGLDRKRIESELKSGNAKGYGIITGDLSGGILAVDADGPASHELLAKHGELPATVAFTSGKPGRCQYLLKVPQEMRSIVKTVKLNTGIKNEKGKNQLLEFRWNGCQSVLPPSVHPETGRYQWVNSPDSVKIAECPNWVIELIMNAEDAAKPETAFPLNYAAQSDSKASRPDNIPLPVPETIPLEVCLAKSSRDLQNGISEGGRNDAGIALARDLIGTANYLNSIGQRFDGDPRMMLEDFAARCSPPLPAREVETIWKSANKGNPSPACKADGVDNCIRGWYWNNYAKKTSGQAIGRSSNVITHPRFTPPDPAELTEQFATIYNAGLSGHKLTKALQPLGVNLQQTRKNYEEYVEEVEREEQRADRKADVEKLISISKRRLTLENYLHPLLAEPIKQFAIRMGVDSETFLTFLLPIVAGLINPNSSIVAKECINFEEPFLLYMMVAALSGDRKSPPLKVVKAALARLQSAEDKRYDQALRVYEAEVQALKETTNQQRKDNNELPQKPNPPREFFVDNVTTEALDKIKGQQPDHGLTLIKDELSGLFASHGAYKGGKGADKESYLSGWNGGGVKKNRSGDGSRVSLARDSLSITGAIQPDKLRALLGDFSDAQGEWARFLFYHMPSRSYKIPRDDRRFDMADLLEGIYKRVDALPILRLRFDKPGQTHFDDWHDKKDEQKLAENRPGLRAAIAKMPGQAVRLIGVLHVLYEVASGAAEVPEIIPLARIQAGCKLADFYLGQVTLLQGDGDVLNGELTPVLKGLLDKVNQRGSLTATEAKKMIWSLRKSTPDKIRQSFSELAAMDLADVQGTGSKLVLVSKDLMTANNHQQQSNPSSARIPDSSTPKELRIVDEVLMNHQQPESFIQQGIQDIKYQTVDVVDGVDKISLAETNIQSSKVELDDGAIYEPIEKPTTIINTSTSSTVGSQTHIPQESQTVDEFSTPASTVEDSSTKLAQKFARRIIKELRTKSRAGAYLAKNDLQAAVSAGKLTEAAVSDILGEEKYHQFNKLVSAAQDALVEGQPVEITLNSEYQGRKGTIARIGYSATETDYYVQLDDERVLLSVPLGGYRFAYLRKLSETTPEPASETVPESAPTPEPATEPEPTPETEPIALTDNSSAPESAEAVTETAPTPEPASEAAPAPENATEPTPELAPIPESETTPEPALESAPEPATETVPEPATVLEPSPAAPEPAPELPPVPEFKVNDRVIVTEHASSLHKGVKGIIGRRKEKGENIWYEIRFDKASHGQRAIDLTIPKKAGGLIYLIKEPKKPCK